MPRTKLVNGERIDFTQAEEDTRDAEEAAWTAEQAAPKPDWPGFRLALLASSEWQRVHGDASAPYREHLTSLMWRVGSDSTLFVEVATVWGTILVALSPSITSGEISAINSICSTYHMPFELNASTGAFELA